MATFEDIKQLIEDHRKDADFIGPVSENEILQSEKVLSVQFPEEYKMFLRTYGCGNLGSEEIFGVGVKPMGIPSVVWATKEQRKAEIDFPSSYVVVYNAGLGELMCLDTSRNYEGKCPVIAWRLGAGTNQKLQTIAGSFIDFIFNQFSEQY